MNIQSASLRISCVSSMGTPYVSSSASSARLKAVSMLRRVVDWIAFIWECESMPCTDPKRQAAHTERTMSFILLTLASWPSLWRISASRLKKKSQSIASSLATCSSLARSRAPPSGTGARAPDELILGIPLYGDFGLRAHWPGLCPCMTSKRAHAPTGRYTLPTSCPILGKEHVSSLTKQQSPRLQTSPDVCRPRTLQGSLDWQTLPILEHCDMQHPPSTYVRDGRCVVVHNVAPHIAAIHWVGRRSVVSHVVVIHSYMQTHKHATSLAVASSDSRSDLRSNPDLVAENAHQNARCHLPNPSPIE
mmetsp:Transcript_22584/g.70741  ORF Transcript_22584/g.70741 Transcript_22584/m.70741 type:complete len:305 (+) Transcript_22584:1535-2449(+)